MLAPTTPPAFRRNSFNIRRGGGPARSVIVNSSKNATDILTGEQKTAFREVFDLFDSNGGGSIDADELDEALRSAEINVTKEEINEVLSSMDKDGNGEIDFEEFLQLMTNTERFLESVICKEEAATRQREIVLFEALTQFMKKSALHSINEIVGYYHNKYKKVQTPHVIRHYADGARLIGLSEQQIRRHLDQLRRSANDSKSPYAQPPYAYFHLGNQDTGRGRVKLENITEESTPAKIRENLKMLVPDPPTQTCRGRIRLKIVWDQKEKDKVDKVPSSKSVVKSNENNILHNIPKKRQNGWVAQRFNPSSVQDHLPILTTRIVKKQLVDDNGFLSRFPRIAEQEKKKILNFDDMAGLRDKVKTLANTYYAGIQKKKQSQANQHWLNLAVHEMPSNRLRKSYERAFNAYADYKNTPVSSLCSSSLA